MKRKAVSDMSDEQLVERFIANCLEQEQALLYDDINLFNRLFALMRNVVNELKGRPGDQRHALLDLYDHPNLQVRIKAVKNSLALAPDEGRRVLQEIANVTNRPQALEAGMSLRNLKAGIFKPT